MGGWYTWCKGDNVTYTCILGGYITDIMGDDKSDGGGGVVMYLI